MNCAVELSSNHSLRDSMVVGNMFLVNHFVYMYATGNFYSHKDDLYEAGVVGLMKAAEKCVGKDVNFVAYASVCIKNEMISYIRSWNRKTANVVSLDMYIDNGGGDDKTITLMDKLESAADDVAKEIEDLSDHREVYRAIQMLESSRERQIISMRYLYGKKQSEIAKSLGVSQAYVSKVEKSALAKMKAQLDGLV